MGAVALDSFAGCEVERIFIARKVSEAKRVEEILTASGIEYAVELEPFKWVYFGLFPVQYTGAAFYVLSGQSQFCKELLAGKGFRLLDDQV